LHVILKVLIYRDQLRTLEASYLEDLSIAKGTRGVEEAEPKKAVNL
jgi:hypothetical protein